MEGYGSPSRVPDLSSRSTCTAETISHLRGLLVMVRMKAAWVMRVASAIDALTNLGGRRTLQLLGQSGAHERWPVDPAELRERREVLLPLVLDARLRVADRQEDIALLPILPSR